MESLDEPLDIVEGKIQQMEKNIFILNENITLLSEQLKETQKYLVQLAKNNAILTKRISTWPFIGVPEERGE